MIMDVYCGIADAHLPFLSCAIFTHVIVSDLTFFTVFEERDDNGNLFFES